LVMAAYDFLIVGAGMAGASLAAALVRRAAGVRVLIVEAEGVAGYHATGRSAAFWTESYGGAGVVPLTLASHAELSRRGVLRARGALTLAREGELARAEGFAQRFADLGVRVEVLGRSACVERVPGLRGGWVGGVWEPDCCDIDVARLHQMYLAEARAGGVELRVSAGLVAAGRDGLGWRVVLADGLEVVAGVVVNAAGAWADDVAARCGARGLGVRPLRRTMVQVRVAGEVSSALPLVLDLGETFYFKPESGRLWLSPHDEALSAAVDAAAEEIDVALAVDRLEGVVDWQVEAVERRWAGLRSFAPDRLPVYGFDGCGLFWFAGQGGFGIQTAPAAAEVGAFLLLGAGDCPVEVGRYRASRFF